MEYIFGTNKKIEILKTKGSEHTDLTGYHEVKREYPDQIITDNFRVVKKYDSKEDAEGNCYDWYEIDHHYRVQDKFTPQEPEIDKRFDSNDDALIEIAEMIAEQSDALMEIASLLEG